MELPFEVGALYNRKSEIHGLLGGQQQGGISTPKDRPVVIAFTGEAGAAHGYNDEWDDEGVFHYVGEGQEGDMTYSGGNRAIENHIADGKKLILFQMMGKGKPYRYLGEFVRVSSYIKPNTAATRGANRNAIVFRLVPLDDSAFFSPGMVREGASSEDLSKTITQRLIAVRKKQALFRRRLLTVEKECRLTGVRDLRFLRASHIKPWSECTSGDERTDGHNGVLLTPHADLLFDRGWITFENTGRLVVASELPSAVRTHIGLNLRSGRNCGTFSHQQRRYLDYHRDHVFEKRHQAPDDLSISALEALDQYG